MDLIDRQAAIDAIRGIKANYCETADDQILLIDKAMAMAELMMLPSAQPERTHCKECRWFEPDRHQCGIQIGAVFYEDDYCSYAERRTDGQTD